MSILESLNETSQLTYRSSKNWTFSKVQKMSPWLPPTLRGTTFWSLHWKGLKYWSSLLGGTKNVVPPTGGDLSDPPVGGGGQKKFRSLRSRSFFPTPPRNILLTVTPMVQGWPMTLGVVKGAWKCGNSWTILYSFSNLLCMLQSIVIFIGLSCTPEYEVFPNFKI